MAAKKLTITIIGAGNAATVLGLNLKKKGVLINEIYSNTFSTSKTLAKKLEATPIKTLKELDLNADIYLLAVNDDSISKVAQKLKLKNKIVVHCSGSTEMKTLNGCSKQIGVFYPLQTLKKDNHSSLKNIPILIEGNSKKTTSTLLKLAKLISDDVYEVNSKKRIQIHLAAVLVSNFTNHLFTLSDEMIKSGKIDYKILLPLFEQVIANLKKSPPKTNQTGPAIRRDKKTISKHLELLDHNKELKTIYRLLSNSIQKHNQK